MDFQHVNVVHVKYSRGNRIIPVGRLAFLDRKIFFEYETTFLKLGLELSPFKLPLKTGVIACSDRVFDGLFGVFNDSLPDGWGRLLLDRKLKKVGVNSDSLTPLDRLRYVGSHGMGALIFEPEISMDSNFEFHEDLDVIAEECFEFDEHDEDQFVDELLALNGSSAGARPKILVNLAPNKAQPQFNNPIDPLGVNWIIKFCSSTDPKDAGSIEYAYHLMAREAGLELPEARLFKSKKHAGYFGVKRFDRQGSKVLHMHTFSGLFHIDHRIPSIDYEALMNATLWLTKNEQECEKQFRHAVFNVLSHNRDDHAKNFSFLMDENGVWRVSPAYDLIFSSGPGGEHHTTIMKEGKNPGISQLLKLAEIGLVKPKKAVMIIQEVKEAVSKWPYFASKAFVSHKSSEYIQRELEKVLRNF